MNHSIPPMEYAPTADYALDAVTLPGLSGIDDAILVTLGLVCGAIFLIGMAWLISNSRRPAREQPASGSECGKVEPLSDGYWICVCPNPSCREIGNVFEGPRGGRNLNLEEATAEYRRWQHKCGVSA